jgi:hypothetical protein
MRESFTLPLSNNVLKGGSSLICSEGICSCLCIACPGVPTNVLRRTVYQLEINSVREREREQPYFLFLSYPRQPESEKKNLVS